jgi:hypothetical protein
MRYLSAILAMSIVLVFGLGCSESGDAKPAEKKSGVPTVESVTMLSADGTEVKQFKPTDNPQKFAVKMSEMGAARVKAVFTAVDADGQKNVKLLDKELELTDAMNTASYSLKLPSDFPVGNYKIDVHVNDKLAKTVEYKVQ